MTTSGFLRLAFVLLVQTGAKKLHVNKSSSLQQSRCPSPDDPITSIDDLNDQSCNVLHNGNNWQTGSAASFKWFKFLADRAASKSESEFLELNKGYCPISGGPISGEDSGKVTLRKVGGGTETGLFYFCCPSCLCDMVDVVRVDTKSIARKGGSSSFRVLVIGNPCENPSKLIEQFDDPVHPGTKVTLRDTAPEVACTGSKLDGAILSDGGHPIVGILHPNTGSATVEDTDMVKECKARKVDSEIGMGEIFRKVAEITPLS